MLYKFFWLAFLHLYLLIGSKQARDKFDILCLHRVPDFYYTLLIMLHNSPSEPGGAETEGRISYKLSVSESLSKLRGQDKGKDKDKDKDNSVVKLACNFEYKAGDIILMNGKMLYLWNRGRENKLPDFVRHAIYIVYSTPKGTRQVNIYIERSYE